MWIQEAVTARIGGLVTWLEKAGIKSLVFVGWDDRVGWSPVVASSDNSGFYLIIKLGVDGLGVQGSLACDRDRDVIEQAKVLGLLKL